MANGERNERDRHDIAAASQVVLVSDLGGVFPGARADGPGATQGGSLGSLAAKALQDVLGWKINAGDSRGFMNALNQSFELTMSEGVVQSKWTPRSYAVQTDLSGGISGAQASLYTMAKIILDQALPLLDGLTPLKPDADGEYIEVLKQLARSQMTELVTELGQLGGPRVVRVDQYFQILIGASAGTNDYAAGQDKVTVDPDLVVGTLGGLREQMGLRAIKSELEPSYVNSVSDEQDVTNFRVVVDYVNAIFNSWTNSRHFFRTMKSPFLGTQLVWISRQLGVVNEAVEEVRFMMNSAFVGPAERETLLLRDLEDADGHKLSDITMEALLSWIQSFVTSEGPNIIQAGGRFAIGEDFEQIVRQLRRYAHGLVHFAEHSHSSGLGSDRVVGALKKLARQLRELHQTARPVETTELPGGPGPAAPPPELPPPPAPTPRSRRSDRAAD